MNSELWRIFAHSMAPRLHAFAYASWSCSLGNHRPNIQNLHPHRLRKGERKQTKILSNSFLLPKFWRRAWGHGPGLGATSPNHSGHGAVVGSMGKAGTATEKTHGSQMDRTGRGSMEAHGTARHPAGLMHQMFRMQHHISQTAAPRRNGHRRTWSPC